MCSKIGGGCVLSLLSDTNGGGGGTLQRVKINLGGSLGLVLEVCTILNGAPFGQNFIYYGAPFQAEMRTQGCVITWQLCSILSLTNLFAFALSHLISYLYNLISLMTDS